MPGSMISKCFALQGYTLMVRISDSEEIPIAQTTLR